MAITEDYVSFETAKLLKEKGFDQNCATYYLDGQVWRHYSGEVIPKGKQIYAAPTQAIAMKWLREVHHIFLSIQQHVDMSYVWYAYMDGFAKGCDRESHNNTYEQACEVAIKYCLENLIQNNYEEDRFISIYGVSNDKQL